MHIAIIGNGIAGVTAARTIRKKSDFRITVISSESKHFYSRTALMYIYMGHMKYEHTKPYEDFFWEKNGIDLVFDHVHKIDFTQKSLHLKSGPDVIYDKLILATGSKSNKFGWPGQDLEGVQGLYSLQDLELLEKNTHPPHTPLAKRKVEEAVIVGGGLIGVEMAEMLTTRNIHPTFLILEDHFWGNVLPKEEGILIGNHLESHGVTLHYNTELQEIKAGKNGRVGSVMTRNGTEIKCQLVGLTPGVHPNIDLIRDTELKTEKGILVNHKLETNVEDVYAAGDCVQFESPPNGRQAIEPVWYTGRMMGEVVGKNITGDSTAYNPGPWFNSAKFFDIEYQVYGFVPNEFNEGQKRFYWENFHRNKCLRLVGDNSGRITGMHVFGIRLRHEMIDRWIRQERKLNYVMEHLHDASFETEFYKNEIPGIIEAYNAQFGTQLVPLKKSWKRILSR